jgi:putative sterol carrier protein
MPEPREETAMSVVVSEFFDRVDTLVDRSRTAGMRNSYRFEISGAGTWTVLVDDGEIRVHQGGGDAQCVIFTSADVFAKIITGKLSPITSFMTGRLKVNGDLSAAMKLQNIL